MRAALGWIAHAIILAVLGVAIWRQASAADRAHALLEEMRQREQDRDKPPRRSVVAPVSGVGNKGYRGHWP